MYWKIGIENLPENKETLIWRYMDFTKFVYMLDANALFFCRADCLDDRFEGRWGRRSIQKIKTDLEHQANTGVNVVGGVEEQMRGIVQTADHMRKVMAVNCWHVNDHESAAMWRLYIQAGQGIAICSTVDRLIKAISDDHNMLVFVGTVNYIDYDSEEIPFRNYTTVFLHKRKSFAHEQELRAVATKAHVRVDSDRMNVRLTGEEFQVPGEDLAVDLLTLIRSVHLAPGSPGWMERLVRSVLSRFGLEVPVNRSKLDEEPA
jgi:hypothetical protein